LPPAVHSFARCQKFKSPLILDRVKVTSAYARGECPSLNDTLGGKIKNAFSLEKPKSRKLSLIPTISVKVLKKI